MNFIVRNQVPNPSPKLPERVIQNNRQVDLELGFRNK